MLNTLQYGVKITLSFITFGFFTLLSVGCVMGVTVI